MTLLTARDFIRAYSAMRDAAAEGKGCTLLILLAPSADAMAACRIITTLCLADNVSYKIKPVSGYADILAANDEDIKDNSEVRSVLMINCGGPVELQRFLELSDTQVCYVLDCHKPVHHTNIHSDGKIVVIDDDDFNLDDVPELGDEELVSSSEDESSDEDDEDDEDDDAEDSGDPGLASSSDEENELEVESAPEAAAVVPSDSEDEGERSPKRRATAGVGDGVVSPIPVTPPQSPRAGAGAASPDRAGDSEDDRKRSLKRKRVVAAKKPKDSPQTAARKERVKTYYEGQFIGTPSAYIMFQLAVQSNKDRNDLLWLAIVGVTDHLLGDELDMDSYEALALELKGFVEEKNPPPEPGAPAGQNGHVSTVEDVRFMLHRHWSLYDSMYHSRYVATRLSIWVNREGHQHFETLLARMGVPLKQCKELYTHMSGKARRQFHRKLVELGGEFDLDNVHFASFVRQLDYRTPVSASDVVHSVTALLEAPRVSDGATAEAATGPSGGATGAEEEEERPLGLATDSWVDNFWEAYRALSGDHNSTLMDGIQHAIDCQKALVKLAPELVARRTLWSTGTMRVLRIDDLSETERVLFTQPRALSRLGRYLIEMHQESKQKWLGSRAKPLVLCALDAPRRQYTVVGLPCPGETGIVEKTQFSMAFQTAALETNAIFSMDGFDSNVMLIRQDDLHRFTEHLQHELADED